MKIADIISFSRTEYDKLFIWMTINPSYRSGGVKMLMKKNIPNMVLMNIVQNIPSLIVGLIIIIIAVMILGKINSNACESSDIYASLSNQLSSHSEFKNVLSENPRITFMSAEFITNAKKGNVAFFADAQPGQYFLEYPTGFSAIYDPKKDSVVKVLQLEFAPNDLLEKVLAHDEMQNLKNLQPQIIKITNDNLATLQSQLADLTASDIGFYLLNYNNQIIIKYNYQNDSIMKSYTTSQPAVE